MFTLRLLTRLRRCARTCDKTCDTAALLAPQHHPVDTFVMSGSITFIEDPVSISNVLCSTEVVGQQQLQHLPLLLQRAGQPCLRTLSLNGTWRHIKCLDTQITFRRILRVKSPASLMRQAWQERSWSRQGVLRGTSRAHFKFTGNYKQCNSGRHIAYLTSVKLYGI